MLRLFQHRGFCARGQIQFVCPNFSFDKSLLLMYCFRWVVLRFSPVTPACCWRFAFWPFLNPKSFECSTYDSKADLHHFSANKSFRMNTCKSVSKQRTLTSFRMNTYEIPRGAEVSLTSRSHSSVLRPSRPTQFS